MSKYYEYIYTFKQEEEEEGGEECEPKILMYEQSDGIFMQRLI